MPFGDIGTFEYWNAATNKPPLRSGMGGNGKAYIVSTSGTTNLDGNNTWAAGDLVVFGLDQWLRFTPFTNDALTTLFANLPTTLPASPGIVWNNGGVISIS